MRKLIYLTPFLLFIAALNQSCEKDDICGENTATTPLLVIEFYDALNTTETKNLSNTIIYGLNDQNEIVPFNNLGISNGSSISIPLRTDSDITRVGFHMDYDANDLQAGNLDLIDFLYTPDQVYVSRACGYKTVYNELSVSLIADSNNWIQNIEILKDTIENEIEAHVKIYH